MSAPGAMEDPTQVRSLTHDSDTHDSRRVDTSSLPVAADGPVRDHVTPSTPPVGLLGPTGRVQCFASCQRRVRLPPSEDAGGAGQRADGGR